MHLYSRKKRHSRWSATIKRSSPRLPYNTSFLLSGFVYIRREQPTTRYMRNTIIPHFAEFGHSHHGTGHPPPVTTDPVTLRQRRDGVKAKHISGHRMWLSPCRQLRRGSTRNGARPKSLELDGPSGFRYRLTGRITGFRVSSLAVRPGMGRQDCGVKPAAVSLSAK